MKNKTWFEVTATKSKFDERQNLVRGQTFFHTVCVLIVLLIVNAFLADKNIVWASGFHTNLLIVFVGLSVCGIELALRDAYTPAVTREKVLFTTDKSRSAVHRLPTVNIALLAVAVILIVLCVIRLTSGDKFIENSALSDTASELLVGAMMFCVGAVSLIKQITEGLRIVRELEAELNRDTRE
jgi:hypothetical protein